ncbi:MAG: hypothetical protein GXY94_00910 [Bacteroidales bacterium]|nr:hypothetical protein [Bacteroidales bacterium]
MRVVLLAFVLVLVFAPFGHVHAGLIYEDWFPGVGTEPVSLLDIADLTGSVMPLGTALKIPVIEWSTATTAGGVVYNHAPIIRDESTQVAYPTMQDLNRDNIIYILYRVNSTHIIHQNSNYEGMKEYWHEQNRLAIAYIWRMPEDNPVTVRVINDGLRQRIIFSGGDRYQYSSRVNNGQFQWYRYTSSQISYPIMPPATRDRIRVAPNVPVLRSYTSYADVEILDIGRLDTTDLSDDYIFPGVAPNDPYGLKLVPRDEGYPDVINPDDPLRTWDWLRQFGVGNVPGTKGMQQLVDEYWPEEEEGIYRVMYYVIRQTPDGLYKVDLYGFRSHNIGPDDRWPYAQFHYKKPKLFGLFGGYYELKVFYDSYPTFYAWVLAGQNRINLPPALSAPSGGWTGIKINKSDRIIAFGKFYPDDSGTLPIPEPPPLVRPPVDAVPPPYDPNYDGSGGGLWDTLSELAYSLFVPSSFDELFIVKMLGDYLAPATNLIERIGELANFEVRDTFPSGFLTLWGRDFAPTLNSVLGTTVSVPIFGSYSLYGLSRLISLVGIVGIMLSGIIRAVVNFFRGGGNE